MVKSAKNKKIVVSEKTKKVKGIYGNYGVRQVGNKIHTRIRKTINNEPKDFCGKGVTLELAIADLEHQIELALNKEIAIDADITVKDWCNKWLNTKTDKESLAYYEQHIRCYIVPVIGKMKLCDVKLNDLNRITSKMAKGELSETSRKKGLTMQELKESKKPLSKKTIANVKNTISQIFQEAIDNDMRRPLPLSKIKNDGAESKERTILNKEQKSKLLNFLVNDEKEDTKTVSLMLLIQYTRGLRASEVCGLKWEDIDFDKNELHLNQGCGRVRDFDEELRPTGTYTTKLKSLKTKNSKRTLNFDELIFEKLMLLNKQEHNTDGLVFHTKTGLKHTCKSIYKILQRILRDLGLPSIGTHGLRRIFATNLVLNQVDQKVAQLAMGHSDISTTYKYYVEIEQELENKILTGVDDVVLAEVKNKMTKVS